MRRALFFIVAIFCAATSYASIPRTPVLDGASISRASMLDAAPPIAHTLSETRIRVSDVLAPFERPAPSPLNRALHQAYAASSTTNASGLGRFLSVDPTWESADSGKPQSWNRYAYALNSPVNKTDPDGRYPVAVAVRVAAAACDGSSIDELSMICSDGEVLTLESTRHVLTLIVQWNDFITHKSLVRSYRIEGKEITLRLGGPA
jgi:hypothetical protein